MERKKLAEITEGFAANAAPPKPEEEKVGSKGAVGPPPMRGETKEEEEPSKQSPAEKPAAKTKPARKQPAKPRQKPTRAFLRARKRAAKAAKAATEKGKVTIITGESDEATFTVNHLRATVKFVLEVGGVKVAIGLLKAYEAISGIGEF